MTSKKKEKPKEKPPPGPQTVCTVNYRLAQIRKGDAVYYPDSASDPRFAMAGIIVKGFIPADADFNMPFINAVSNDKTMKAKQAEFAKYLNLSVEIKM